MLIEKLTPEERLNAAIALEKIDRIPCAPMIENYAARYVGISNFEFLFDYKKAFDALEAIKERYPVWDIRRSMYHFYYGPFQNTIGTLKSKMPGIDLPANYEHQHIEYEAMKRRDYSIIIEKGLNAYVTEFYKRVHGTSKNDIEKAIAERMKMHLQEIEDVKKCGQISLYGTIMVFPTDLISFMRSFPEFIRDVYQIPDMIEEVISLVTDFQIAEHIQTIKKTGIPRIMIGIARMCGQYFSLTFFERFVWPYLKRLVESFLSEGITPILHLDGDWALNLPYFLEFPNKKIVIELDGCTDIFLVKKMLGNYFCLLGDVPATLFTVGTPEKVKKYCHRLLEEVGEGGGFILSSGCYLPYHADHSNVEAFFHSISL